MTTETVTAYVHRVYANSPKRQSKTNTTKHSEVRDKTQLPTTQGFSHHRMKRKSTTLNDVHIKQQSSSIPVAQQHHSVSDLSALVSPLHHRGSRNGNGSLYSDESINISQNNNLFEQCENIEYRDAYSKAFKRGSRSRFRFVFMSFVLSRWAYYAMGLTIFVYISSIIAQTNMIDWDQSLRRDHVAYKNSWKGLKPKRLNLCLENSSNLATVAHCTKAFSHHYSKHAQVIKSRHVISLHSNQTDPSQLYQFLDSSDEEDHEIMQHMEMRPPEEKGSCVPMQDWQRKYYPTCNDLHEVFIGDDKVWNTTLVGTKGYFRVAWKVERNRPYPSEEAIVLKTLKMVHTFEDDFYDKHRIEAIAMEKLTSSPHVIDVYGFCGQSIMSELADGRTLGKLSDKSSRIERLKIAIDVAEGIADVHEIDGKDNATIVHFDINPGNVIVIHNTLKLNDFNVAHLRKWNLKLEEPCGFSPKFPNPQWRSPEEALGMTNLTEKIDVYSMGNIFYRLICGKSPWGKLDGNPTKEEIHAKVKAGEHPHFPSKVTEAKDPTIIAIREAMLLCYTFDPVKRPSARVIANGLRNAYDEIRLSFRIEDRHKKEQHQRKNKDDNHHRVKDRK